MVLTNNTKTKTNKNKVHDKNKQYKYLIYNSQYSFAKFKDSTDSTKSIAIWFYS